MAYSIYYNYHQKKPKNNLYLIKYLISKFLNNKLILPTLAELKFSSVDSTEEKLSSLASALPPHFSTSSSRSLKNQNLESDSKDSGFSGSNHTIINSHLSSSSLNLTPNIFSPVVESEVSPIDSDKKLLMEDVILNDVDSSLPLPKSRFTNLITCSGIIGVGWSEFL